MRRAAKIDANQTGIVDLFRRAGAKVRHTHMLGSGFPDLFIGVPTAKGMAVALVELKDGSLPPSKRKLTADEQKFFDEWQGAPLYIVENDADALELLRVLKEA